jgi:hypothetical protein
MGVCGRVGIKRYVGRRVCCRLAWMRLFLQILTCGSREVGMHLIPRPIDSWFSDLCEGLEGSRLGWVWLNKNGGSEERVWRRLRFRRDIFRNLVIDPCKEGTHQKPWPIDSWPPELRINLDCTWVKWGSRCVVGMGRYVEKTRSTSFGIRRDYLAKFWISRLEEQGMHLKPRPTHDWYPGLPNRLNYSGNNWDVCGC